MEEENRQKLYSLKTATLDLICRLSDPVREFKPEKNILIFGYPRSGSTWLMELISNLPGTANLWEPLHIRNVEPFQELGFGWRQYIPEHEKWEAAEETFEELFRGEYLNFWLTSRDFPLRFVTADRMIVKFVRANGLIPWLTNKFDFELAPVYLLRHPFAIAASQMKEGSWDYEFKNYEIPDVPYNHIFKRHESFLSTLKTKGEEMVATWCINNKIVFDHDRHNKDWTTIFYESLLLHPERELQCIFDLWGMLLPEELFEDLRDASSTTQKATFHKGLDTQLSKWKRYFDHTDVDRMIRVLDYFEIDIYNDHLLPRPMMGTE